MDEVRSSVVQTQFGCLEVSETAEHIVGVKFVMQQPTAAASVCPLARKVQNVVRDMSWDKEELPLRISGTPFQQRVWRELRRIPLGETRTYSEMAASIGSPGSARAVGAACGKNGHVLLVPCHRVVAKHGRIGGYSCIFGASLKETILAAEKQCCS